MSSHLEENKDSQSETRVKTKDGLTYCHTPTNREPASQEEQGKDGDDVGRDLKQSAANQVQISTIQQLQCCICKVEPDNDVEVQVARDEAA